MKSIACILALAAIGATQPLSAQPLSGEVDLSEREVAQIARFALPSAFQAVQLRCRQHLAADAYLYAEGAALHSRLVAASRGSWPEARDIALGMLTRENSEMAGIFNQMPSETLRPFAEELIAGALASEIEPDNCGQIDRVLELLDPLPAENLAPLLGIIAAEAQKAKAQEGG